MPCYNNKLNEVEDTKVRNTFIVTAIHGKYIERCLDTLVNSISRDEHRIIFLEAPSLEDREILYNKVKDKVDIYVRTEHNYGWSKTVNMACHLVTTPYFTVVHDDVTFPHKGWFDIIAEQLDISDKMLMVQPAQRNRRDDEHFPEDPTPQQVNEILATCKGTSVSEIYCLVFKKSWLDIVGFFEESYYPIGPEDVEFYLQAKAKGYSIGVTANAFVYHKGVGRHDGSGGARVDFEQKFSRFTKKWGGVPDQVISGEGRQPTLLNLIKPL